MLAHELEIDWRARRTGEGFYTEATCPQRALHASHQSPPRLAASLDFIGPASIFSSSSSVSSHKDEP